MTSFSTVSSPASFTHFGKLLKYLRRRARLTQLELAAAVGYTNAHLCRLENGQRQPDSTALAALFIPALGLEAEPHWGARLLELAQEAHTENVSAPSASLEPFGMLETVPSPYPEDAPRTLELAQVRAQLERERRVAICGWPGIGKTWLAAALARQYAPTRPALWLTLTPGITDSAETFIRQAALFLWNQGCKTVRPLLTPSTALAPIARDQQLAVLGAALARHPALLCLDNAHHLHAELLTVLQHLLATTPAWFLFASRADLPLVGVRPFRLAGLRPEEGQGLVERLAGAERADWAREYGPPLLDKTNGNPMLLRLVVGQWGGADQPAAFIAQLSQQPEVVMSLLSSITADLSPEARGLVELLTLFRQPINLLDETLADLGRLAPQPFDLMKALAETRRRYLIDHPDRAALWPLLRQHLYLALAPETRRRLHRLVARWWEERDEVEAAHHFAQGGERSQAVEVLARHTDHIIAQGQALAAVRVLDEVLRHPRATNGSVSLTRRARATRAYLLTGTVRAAEAEADYALALRLTTNPAVRANLIHEAALLWVQRGKTEEAVALIDSALAALTPADQVLQARLSAMQGQYLFRLSQNEKAVLAANRALEVCQTLSALTVPALDEARARAHLALGNVRRVQGDYATALHHRQQARRAAQQARLPRLECASLDAVGTIRYEMGDLAGARQDREAALALARAIGSHYNEAYALTHLAEVHLVRCEFDEALEKLYLSRPLMEQIGEVAGLATADTLWAVILRSLGQVADARTRMEALLLNPYTYQADPFLSHYLTQLAILQLLEGQSTAAQQTLTQATDLARRSQIPALMLEVLDTRAWAALAAGQTQRAHEILGELPEPAIRAQAQGRYYHALTRASVALALGHPAEAQTWADAIAAQAGSAGFELYRRRAHRIRQALSQPPIAADWPRLFWVEASHL